MVTHIVVVGGGFAGVRFCQALRNYPDYRITLVDQNNYNFFPPLIYQLATGFLEPSSIAYPFRRIFRGASNVRFLMGKLVRVAPSEKLLCLDVGNIRYDALVLATGTQTNFFGMAGIEQFAIPMKTMDDALNMRNVLLRHLEEASRTENPDERRRLLTLVIAGGGPTGVELAGVFAEMRQKLILREYPEFLNERQAPIVLVTAGKTLLEPMSAFAQTYTEQTLRQMGVELILNTFVTDYDGEVVCLSDDSRIETRNVIWASGVMGRRIEGLPDEAYGPGARLWVNEYHAVRGVADVYALGDCALMAGDPDYPKGHPQMGQGAIQHGLNLAHNFKQRAKHGAARAFRFDDKGSMAMIGRNKAVADLASGRHLKGMAAWWAWLVVHLMALVNVRNRVRTFYNWAVSFLFEDQHLRMILRPEPRKSAAITGGASAQPKASAKGASSFESDTTT